MMATSRDGRTVAVPHCRPSSVVLRLLGLCAVLPVFISARPQSDGNNNEVAPVCQQGYSPCATVNKCVHDSFWCDGDNDCGDNSDENILFCRSHSCAEGQVKCDSGQCIEFEEFCSGQTMCQDGSVRKNRRICPEAEPSFEMCLDAVIGYCAKPFSDRWAGLDSWQLRQKIINTKMNEICRSLKEVKSCADDTLQVGCHADDAALMPDFYKTFRSDYGSFIDIICDRELEVVDNYKDCLLGYNTRRVDVFDAIEKCIQSAESKGLGCGSEEFEMCLILEMWQTCGDPIASAAHRHRSQLVNFVTNYLMPDACSQLEPQEPQRRGLKDYMRKTFHR